MPYTLSFISKKPIGKKNEFDEDLYCWCYKAEIEEEKKEDDEKIEEVFFEIGDRIGLLINEKIHVHYHKPELFAACPIPEPDVTGVCPCSFRGFRGNYAQPGQIPPSSRINSFDQTLADLIPVPIAIPGNATITDWIPNVIVKDKCKKLLIRFLAPKGEDNQPEIGLVKVNNGCWICLEFVTKGKMIYPEISALSNMKNEDLVALLARYEGIKLAYLLKTLLKL